MPEPFSDEWKDILLTAPAKRVKHPSARTANLILGADNSKDIANLSRRTNYARRIKQTNLEN